MKHHTQPISEYNLACRALQNPASFHIGLFGARCATKKIGLNFVAENVGHQESNVGNLVRCTHRASTHVRICTSICQIRMIGLCIAVSIQTFRTCTDPGSPAIASSSTTSTCSRDQSSGHGSSHSRQITRVKWLRRRTCTQQREVVAGQLEASGYYDVYLAC